MMRSLALAIRPAVRALLIGALVCVVSMGLLAATPSAARADSERTAAEATTEDPPPEGDVPNLPDECFAPGHEGDHLPGACHLTAFHKQWPTLILWGDSHAYQFIPALQGAVENKRVNLVGFVAGACPPAIVTERPIPGKCERNNVLAIRYIREMVRDDRPVEVILGSNWGGFRQAYRRLQRKDLPTPAEYTPFVQRMIRLSHVGTPLLFDALGDLEVDTDVIAQSATVPARVPSCPGGRLPYVCDLARTRAFSREDETASWLQDQASKLAGRPRYIDTTPTYCNARVCHGQIGEITTFHDDLHLSATRAGTMSGYFAASVREAVRMSASR